MFDAEVRTAVAQYLSGELTEEEAARRADLPRAQLRQYARTCGSPVLVPAQDAAEEGDAERRLHG